MTRKLSAFVPLGEDDKAALRNLAASPCPVVARQDLLLEGELPDVAFLILEGFACRYRALAEGKRQILDFLIPGDLCGGAAMVAGPTDHAVCTLSSCVVAVIRRRSLVELAADRPRIAEAFGWSALAEAGMLRAWITGLGQRSADQRMAHLFCELSARLQAVGLATENGYEWPVAQADLADAMGLSAVHVNRTIQRLRSLGLIAIERKRLTIPDPERLRAFGGFTPDYLHLTASKRGQALDGARRLDGPGPRASLPSGIERSGDAAAE